MAERTDGSDLPGAPHDRPDPRDGSATSAGAPHSGWSRQPQSSYDLGDSGGWGGPTRRENTGPVPRLSRDPQRESPGSSSDASSRAARAARPPLDDSPSTAETAWHINDRAPDGGGAPPLRHPEDDAAHDNEHEPLLVDTRQAAGPQGSGSGSANFTAATAAAEVTRPAELPRVLADPTFQLRATRVLVPPTYVVVVLFLVLDYMRSIFNYSGAAGTSAGGFVGMLILLVVGLLKIAVVVFLTRLILELCLNVAEMRAETRRGAGR